MIILKDIKSITALNLPKNILDWCLLELQDYGEGAFQKDWKGTILWVNRRKYKVTGSIKTVKDVR
jgi:hypothetical protein